MGDRQKRYPDELRERAVRMVLDARAADPNDNRAITRIAEQLGVRASPIGPIDAG